MAGTNGSSSPPGWGWPGDLALDDAALDDAALDAAYTAPSTSRPAFLSAILNHNREAEDSAGPSDMPPRRAARLPNGYVDLTNEADAPQPPKRRTSAAEPPAKRRRASRPAADSTPESASGAPPNYEAIDVLDLSDEPKDIQQVLQKQRAEAVAAQKAESDEATTFNKFNCVICMDTPTDITATSCGHLFCHSCLMEALIAGENRTQPGEQRKSQCPVCRKYLNRNKPQDIIPLLLMKKGLATQPRKNSTASAGKVK